MGNRTLSNKLRVAFEEILKMPYFENERARSGKTINGHEDAIAIRFEEAGLTKLQNEDLSRLVRLVSLVDRIHRRHSHFWSAASTFQGGVCVASPYLPQLSPLPL